MINPFIPFAEQLIAAFIQSREIYLVSQTFTRGKNLFAETGKQDIILTHYEDKGLAIGHLTAVKKNSDQWAAMIELNNEKHVAKLREMLAPNSKYQLYSSLIYDKKMVQDSLNKVLAPNVKSYIGNVLTWHIPAHTVVKAKPRLIFGELFVHLKYGSQEKQVKLADLENI